MRRIWNDVDRWGPLVVALLTFLAVVALAWQYGVRLARMEAYMLATIASQQAQITGLQTQINTAVATRASQDVAQHAEIALLQTYVTALREDMIRAGVEVRARPGRVDNRRAPSIQSKPR